MCARIDVVFKLHPVVCWGLIVCSVRESVDIMKLSQMVKGNLVGRVDQENAESGTSDVSLAHADTEVDFHMQQEHGISGASLRSPTFENISLCGSCPQRFGSYMHVSICIHADRPKLACNRPFCLLFGCQWKLVEGFELASL